MSKIYQGDHRGKKKKKKKKERDEIKAFRSIKIKEIKSDKERERDSLFVAESSSRQQEIALSIKVIKRVASPPPSLSLSLSPNAVNLVPLGAGGEAGEAKNEAIPADE